MLQLTKIISGTWIFFIILLYFDMEVRKTIPVNWILITEEGSETNSHLCNFPADFHTVLFSSPCNRIEHTSETMSPRFSAENGGRQNRIILGGGWGWRGTRSMIELNPINCNIYKIK